LSSQVALTLQKRGSYACRGYLNSFDVRQLRAKAAALVAQNSIKAWTGILRRKTYVVYGFQTRFALTFVLLSAFNTAMTAVVVYRLLGGPEGDVDRPSVTSRLMGLEPRLVLMFVGLLILLFTSLGVLFVATVVATHRVAGPIAVMQKHMAALAAGRYPALRPLREHDELKDFFAQLRKLVERLRAKDLEEGRILQQVVEALSPMVGGMKAHQALASLKTLIDAKQQALDPTKPGEVAQTFAGETAVAPIRIESR
jgi:flagellar biosynthesis/type III secretory pathway chaperone